MKELEYCSIYKEFIIKLPEDSLGSMKLRPSAGLNLDKCNLLIESSLRTKASKEANYWLSFIETNINRGLSDKLTIQLAEYRRHGYTTDIIICEVLSLMKICIQSDTTIDSRQFVNAIMAEVQGFVKQIKRKQNTKFNL